MPFLSFSLGYIVMQHSFHTPEVTTPHLIGKQVHEILSTATKHKLNIRLMDQKEEADLPEGIIINQIPASGTCIKPNQPLLIVTTKKPTPLRAPLCVGLTVDHLIKQLNKTDIRPRIYHLPHAYPEKICFAQSPQPDEPLEQNRLIIYISAGNDKPVIWPNFITLPLEEVIDFLEGYSIKPHIINDSANARHHNEYRVTDQRPFAGTLLTLDNKTPLSVQLRVQ